MQKLILIIKGFIIGTANIVPGVSGGTLMVTLNVFEDIIHSVNHFFSDISKNFKFLLFLGIGVILSFLVMSYVITYSMENFKVQTIMLFIAIIIGGLPALYSNVKSEKLNYKYIIAFMIPFALVVIMSLINAGTPSVVFDNMNAFSYIKLFLVGMLASSAMVVPGLSGSFILMLLGYYTSILECIKGLLTLNNVSTNFTVLLIFGLGIILGLLGIIKLIEYLLDNHKNVTYFSILGFIFGSIIAILISNFSSGVDLSFLTVLQTIIIALIGFFITYKVGTKRG